MKWLITGGCGFIGTNLIRRLVEEGIHEIRVLDDLSVGSREDLAEVADFSEVIGSSISTGPDKIELVIGDICDETLATDVTKGIDVIVHLAANTGVGPSVENPREDCLKNVIGTFNYLEAARLNGVSRFIFASSGAPAGEVEPPIHEEMAPHPVSPYGASKLAGEGYCSAYYQTFKINTVCLRFGNVYGPGSKYKSSVVAKFIRQALNGETLEIYGDGGQTRDFIYIYDLIDAIMLSSEKDVGGEVFQIASNCETTVKNITEKIIKTLSEKGIENIDVEYGENRLGDVRRNYSDTSKAEKYLTWKPKVGLDEGLNKTIEYFVD